MITSTRNPKIQWVQSLQSRPRERRAAGAFVVEGVRLAEEALASAWEAQLVLFSDDVSARGRAVVNGFAARGAAIEEVSSQVLRAAGDTQTPQGVLAVLTLQALPLPERLDFLFVPDGVMDPGNLGTMLRTSAAAGVGAVFLPPGAADAFAPKVVRAGMGAHFRLPIHSLDWDAIREQVATRGLRVYLADARAGVVCFQADFRSPCALLIGGEAGGASEAGQALAQQSVHIPMPGGSESLNAAAAAAVLLFEVVRQRSG